MKQRLDKLLLERGLAPTRERAQALILAGRVLVNGQKVEKPGSSVDGEAELRVLGGDLRYVSRGGLKLERALEYWKIDLRGRTCVDVGASTGGFTDCMLQHGAARVIAIDTGYGQIDVRLRNDERVRLLERTNARYLQANDVRERVDFCAMDVSFISATLVLPAVVASVQHAGEEQAPGGLSAARDDTGEAKTRPLEAVVLVKPQFEVGRKLVGKGGIVRDPVAQMGAVEKVRAAMQELGFTGLEWTESPILGTEGNREFLLHGIKDSAMV
jgi:23S rRNA (cytidine1920-2'-O)/16S rRNA (cytidine1409-2'-O)-methyltransferase